MEGDCGKHECICSYEGIIETMCADPRICNLAIISLIRAKQQCRPLKGGARRRNDPALPVKWDLFKLLKLMSAQTKVMIKTKAQQCPLVTRPHSLICTPLLFPLTKRWRLTGCRSCATLSSCQRSPFTFNSDQLTRRCTWIGRQSQRWKRGVGWSVLIEVIRRGAFTLHQKQRRRPLKWPKYDLVRILKSVFGPLL